MGVWMDMRMYVTHPDCVDPGLHGYIVVLRVFVVDT